MEGVITLTIAILILYLICKNKDAQQVTQQNAHEKNMICPHCRTQGTITTQQVKRKQGIHGGKATAALLTCGISLLGTGLSRKQKMTEAHCSHCGANWSF